MGGLAMQVAYVVITGGSKELPSLVAHWMFHPDCPEIVTGPSPRISYRWEFFVAPPTLACSPVGQSAVLPNSFA